MPKSFPYLEQLRAARKRQKGASIVIFCLMTSIVLLPMAGLAIDMAIVFWAKAKLSAAVDAAALAAGRSINVYESTAQNSGSVANIAVQWFWANFPSGWLGTSVVGGTPTVSYITTSTSTQQVTVNASATVPLYFARLIGFKTITIAAQAQSSRRNIFVLLVLDRSGSLDMTDSAGVVPCPIMQQDAINFTNMFTENFDTVGLVTFSTNANYSQSSSTPIDYGPATVFKSGMKSTINSLSCVGGTGTAQGLYTAYQTILNNGGLKSGLNVIVLFTDGQPNTVVGTFQVMHSAQLGGAGKTDTRYGSYPPGYGLNDYNHTYSVGASSCPSSLTTITGALYSSPSSDFSGDIDPAQLGMTWGFYDPFTWVSLSSSSALLSGNAYSGCNFSGNYPGANLVEARLDIASVGTWNSTTSTYSATDYFGNSLVTGYNGDSGYFGSFTGAATPQVYPTSSPFSGQVRTDMEQGSLTPAAINAADYQAAKIRNDSNYNIVIYTIGLGGAPDYPIDATGLERIANDPRSPIYDKTKPAGFFAYASDPSQLNDAFMQVASQILRLSQ